jgi:hypothetical protein
VTIAGTLTTDLGAIDSARNGFVQDATGGIALRLDAALTTAIPAGTTVTATGALGSYFSLRVVTVTAASIEIGPSQSLPEPVGATTGSASEALEGIRLVVQGAVTEAPSALTDGLGVTIDDGSGPLRLVVSPAAQAGSTIHTGDVVQAIGPLGQRDSSGTGAAGYRLHATRAGELLVQAAPTPTPGPTATPTPLPSPTPTPSASSAPSPTPSPTSSPTPSPTPTPTGSVDPAMSIVDARTAEVGERVTVRGVVTAEAGRLGTPPLIAIGDARAGIVVRLSDTDPRPPRGALVEVSGTLADPYGQLEVRGLTAPLHVGGSGPVPAPIPADATTIGEATEASLVVVEGTVATAPTRATSGDFAFQLDVEGGSVRVAADASSGVSRASIHVGDGLRVTGVVGQRATRKATRATLFVVPGPARARHRAEAPRAPHRGPATASRRAEPRSRSRRRSLPAPGPSPSKASSRSGRRCSTPPVAGS